MQGEEFAVHDLGIGELRDEGVGFRVLHAGSAVSQCYLIERGLCGFISLEET